MKTALKEIKSMLLWYLVFAVVTCLGFAVFSAFSLKVLLGVLAGSLFSMLNLLLLGLSTETALSFHGRRGASGVIFLSYLLRYIITFAFIYTVLRYNYLNIWAVIIPLIFPRLIITLSAIFARKEKK